METPKALVWLLFLTLLSGLMNCFMVIEFASSASHHTGNIVQAAIAMFDGETAKLKQLLFMILLFFIAAVLMGAYLSNRGLYYRDHYDYILYIIGILLFITNYLPEAWMIYSFSFILGLMNGFFIHYGSLRVRVTHMTGYLTDAGFAFGQILKGNFNYVKSFVFYISSMACFVVGASLALYFPHYSMVLSSFLAFVLGIYYKLLLKRNTIEQFEEDQKNLEEKAD